MRFANDFHSWLRHSWQLLANRLTRDPKIVIHGNSSIILYFIGDISFQNISVQGGGKCNQCQIFLYQMVPSSIEIQLGEALFKIPRWDFRPLTELPKYILVWREFDKVVSETQYTKWHTIWNDPHIKNRKPWLRIAELFVVNAIICDVTPIHCKGAVCGCDPY